jgi:hypothetical protein
MEQKHRTYTREHVELPVQAGQHSGLTRDISANGFYFMTDSVAKVGSELEVQIELSLPGGKVTLIGWGEVVRIETKGPQTGVAVRLTESRLVPGGES